MHSNYIAGEWKESGQVYRNINPSDTGDCVGEYAVASAADTAVAVAAAKRAFAEWSLSTPQQRFTASTSSARKSSRGRTSWGGCSAREEGKTLPEATGEVVRAGQIFKFFAGESVRLSGGAHTVRPAGSGDRHLPGSRSGSSRLITPWNFPIAIPSWKTAPALAFGNTVGGVETGRAYARLRLGAGRDHLQVGRCRRAPLTW